MLIGAVAATGEKIGFFPERMDPLDGGMTIDRVRATLDELLALAGLSTRPLVRARPFGGPGSDAVLIDTSAVLDGRLLSLTRAGFLRDSPGAPVCRPARRSRRRTSSRRRWRW